MTKPEKKQVIGPPPPPSIFECKTRNDSRVLGTFSKNCFNQKPPQQKNK